MAVYTYSLWDVNTNASIGQVKLSGVQFAFRLNDAGEFSGTLNLADPATRTVTGTLLAYQGVPVKLVIDQGGVIVWSGLVWGRQYQNGSGALQLTGAAGLSLFDAQPIVRSYDVSTYPSGVDPATLVYTAVHDVLTRNAPPGWSVVLNALTSLPAIEPSYTLTQYPSVWRIISDTAVGVTPGLGGVDVYVTDSWVAGAPAHTINVVTPRAGRAGGQTGLFIELSRWPYTWTDDATQSATTVVATGTGSGSQQVQATAVTADPVGGAMQMPPMTQVLNFPGVQSAAEVSRAARGAVATYSKPITVIQATLPVDYPPCPLGSFLIGDDIRLFSDGSDPFLPAGLDSYWRVVDCAVTVADEGVSTMQLTFNRPPIY